MKLVINQPKPNAEEPFPVATIRVWPRNEDIRKYIRHPLTNMRFRETIYDSVEWPFDSFTKRRLNEDPPTVYDHCPPRPPEENIDPAGLTEPSPKSD